jgi:hypothetical protein
MKVVSPTLGLVDSARLRWENVVLVNTIGWLGAVSM